MAVVFTIRKLRGAEGVAGSVEARRLHVEGEKTVAWKGVFEVVEREGEKGVEVSK
jgi:hypothetical protein